MQASGSVSHRVQCWRKGWWGWEAGNPLYCPGMSSLPGTQTPGRKTEREREWERWWEGERWRGRQGRKNRQGNSAMYRSNHLLDPQKKKTCQLSLSSHSFWKENTEAQSQCWCSLISIAIKPIWAFFSRPWLIQRHKKDKIILSSLFTVQTAVSKFSLRGTVRNIFILKPQENAYVLYVH